MLKSDLMIFSIFVLFIKAHFCLIKSSFVSSAITQIIDQSFVDHKRDLNIINYNESSIEFNDLISKVLQPRSGSISVCIIKTIDAKTSSLQMSQTSLHLFESISSFAQALNGSNLVKINNRQTGHLINIKNATRDDISMLKVIELVKVQVNFLIEMNETSIQLATFYYFTQQHCRKNSLEVINTFSNAEVKWRHQNFFPKKHRNFHGCELNIYFWDEPPRNFHSDIGQPVGFNVDLIKILSEHLNFKLNLVDHTNYNQLIEVDMVLRSQLMNLLNFRDVRKDEKILKFTLKV